MDYIRKLRVKNITKLLIGANRIQNKQVAWDLYLTQYPKMNSENYISFSDFYNPDVVPKEPDNRTAEEILAEVKDVLDAYGGEKNRSI